MAQKHHREVTKAGSTTRRKRTAPILPVPWGYFSVSMSTLLRRFLPRPARRAVAIALLAACHIVASPGVSRADSAGSAYAFGKLVVFDTVAVDKVTAQSQRILNVVALDDSSALRVVGRVAMPGKSAYVGAYGHDRDKLIVLLWDRVEIYDLADAAKPRFLRALDLGNQGFSSPGYPRVETDGGGKFALLNTANTTALTLDGEPGQWRVAPLPPPTPAQKSRMTAPPADVLALQTATPLPLYESAAFRYELAWRDTRQPGRLTHRQYLRTGRRCCPESDYRRGFCETSLQRLKCGVDRVRKAFSCVG